MKLLVSACLLGIPCRYCGNGCANPDVLDLRKRHTLIPVCPEQLGGLPTPREPVEIRGGRAVAQTGADCSAAFQNGAREAARIAQLLGCSAAALKSRSPSCGVGTAYDGTFSGKLISGNGFAACALQKAGIPVYSEENCAEISVLKLRRP